MNPNQRIPKGTRGRASNKYLEARQKELEKKFTLCIMCVVLLQLQWHIFFSKLSNP
jgi:hypothetical protein